MKKCCCIILLVTFFSCSRNYKSYRLHKYRCAHSINDEKTDSLSLFEGIMKRYPEIIGLIAPRIKIKTEFDVYTRDYKTLDVFGIVNSNDIDSVACLFSERHQLGLGSITNLIFHPSSSIDNKRNIIIALDLDR